MMNILLVEDSPTDALLMREAIDLDRNHLIHVERLERALAVVAERPIDVILLDLGLPDSQGLSTLQRIQQEAPSIPVVVLAAKADERLALEAVSHGAQEYLVKNQLDAEILDRALRYSVERKRTSDSLRQSEARLTEAVRIARLGYWTRDLKTGRLDWSDLLHEMFGVDPATFQNTFSSYLKCLHPEDRDRVRDTILKAIAKLEPFDHMYRIIQPSGIRFIHETGRVYVEKNGIPVRISGTARDVTEQFKTEEALRESERFARSALDALSSHVVILDENGMILATNKSWREFAKQNGGDPAKVGVGTNYMKSCQASASRPLEAASTINAAIRDIVAGKRTEFSLEYECHSPTEQRWFVCRLSRFSGPGAVRVVVAHENITSIRRAEMMKQAMEEAERTSQAKSEFLATMSHELRTPLNGILGMNELLQATQLTEQQREYVDASTSSGKTLLSLINDILDISKIEAGKIELDWSACHLDKLIRDTMGVFHIEAKKKGIDFACKIAPELGRAVRCDETRFRQVLINLIGNAFKFTSKGSVRVEAECVPIESDRLTVRLSVIDTGIGISNDRISHVFSPFTQADQSTTRRYGGTGLGLSISQRLTELMGGKMGVSSRLGVGSTFWVQIPFDILEEERLNATDAIPGTLDRTIAPIEPREFKLIGLQKNGPSPHILVAEDNKINQLYVTELLRLSGFTCDVVASGDEALSSVQKGQYDLVLMDCQMPEMDGFSATREIRRREQAGELFGRLPIIALTANAVKGDRERCLDAGMDDYLSKPIEGHELVRVLEKHLVKAP
ncbi:response regulator [Pirellulaceae bacterium SH467]